MSEASKGAKTKDKILKDARKLLATRGFNNTTISDIIHATGVKKGNLYYHFASKENLGLAVLEDAKGDFFKLLEGSFTGKNPLEKILTSVKTIYLEIKKTSLVGGCLFGNTALEMSDTNPRFADIIQSVFDYWILRLEEFIRQGQSEKSIHDRTSPRMLAKLVVATVEGFIMMARVSKNENDLTDSLVILKQLLKR